LAKRCNDFQLLEEREAFNLGVLIGSIAKRLELENNE
jgi:hypothetical protein